LEVQRSLLGAAHKEYGRFSIAGATRSANLIGGDYFDSFWLTDEHFAFCIADCMGKGTGAALAMANLQAQLRFEALRAATPADVCESLNRRAFDSRLQRLTTMFYGVVNIRDGALNYTNAGHSPAFLIRADGFVERLHTDDALLGGIPSWRYHQRSVDLHGGDRLIAVTDGLLEANDCAGEEIGEEGLLRRALACRHLTPSEILQKVVDAAVGERPEDLKDDTTALVLGVQ
jgi:sigma-B regulation protein RsbU (phosphoserine phosphatase)